jgi:hypothetical protein
VPRRPGSAGHLAICREAAGLGFAGILVQHEHRALHDLIAGTAVVYAWDARAARLRFLAREAEPGASAARNNPRGSSGGPGGLST